MGYARNTIFKKHLARATQSQCPSKLMFVDLCMYCVEPANEDPKPLDKAWSLH